MVRRTGAATRDSIRSAASVLFRERGFARTSVRDIATRAGSDPALVIRHFGSKELLFLDTMQLEMDHEPLFDVPLESLGIRFITMLLESSDDVRGAYLGMVRGSGESRIAESLRAAHEQAFIRPLRARLTGADADLRARLAAALVGGLLYALWVVGDEALLAADHEDIAHHYGRLLQALLTPGGLTPGAPSSAAPSSRPLDPAS